MGRPVMFGNFLLLLAALAMMTFLELSPFSSWTTTVADVRGNDVHRKAEADEGVEVVTKEMPKPEQPLVSIVVRATGELGNHLKKIVHAKTIEIMARDDHRLRTKLFVRSGEDKRFFTPRVTAKGCFTNINKYVDYGADAQTMREEQEMRLKQQKEWLGLELADLFNLKRGSPPHTPLNREHIHEKLAIVRRVVDGMIESNGNTTKMCSQTITLGNGEEKLVKYTCLPPDVPYSGSTFTLPFLMVFDFGLDEGIDLFYDRIRDFLHYDESGVVLPEGHACCNQLPDPDESVLHFRNFYSEFEGRENAMFLELDPNRTATELLRDLPRGSRVAIVTRFNDERAHEYVSALHAHGFSARIVSGQQGYQDFCFLKNAQRPIFSVARSTFAFFATIIANNRSLPSYRYTIDVPGARVEELNYEWTHPELRNRVHFQLYDP